MFHRYGSVRDSMNLFASLAKVWGKSSTAGVHSIQMELPSATPASPAILPSGTVKYTVEGQEEACGRVTIGSIP
jgi:hypothetical protein